MKSKASRFIDLYNEAVEKLDAPVMMSGRPSIQEAALAHMAPDVIGKLMPRPTDRLLEIGCGTGLLLTPLAALVKEAVGLDGGKVIAKYRELGVPHNVTLMAGEWPLDKPEGTFDRILAYSVLFFQQEADAAFHFVQECIDILRPGGALLLGDLPNRDTRRRFAESPGGAEFDAEWKNLVEKSRVEHPDYYEIFERHGALVRDYFNDSFLLEVMARARAQGLESYLLPQGPDLPFAHTREDVLIRRRS